MQQTKVVENAVAASGCGTRSCMAAGGSSTGADNLGRIWKRDAGHDAQARAAGVHTE